MPLGGVGLRLYRLDWLDGSIQAGQPHRLGLQISRGLGDEYRYVVLGGDVGQRWARGYRSFLSRQKRCSDAVILLRRTSVEAGPISTDIAAQANVCFAGYRVSRLREQHFDFLAQASRDAALPRACDLACHFTSAFID
jgi:hypothetical protein